MRRWVPALVAVLAAIAAFGVYRRPAPAPPVGRDFETPMCAATSLVAARPHPGGHPAFLDWRPPGGTSVALYDLDGEIGGDAPAEPAIVARFDATELAAWTRSDEGGPHLVSPKLPHLEGASRIRVTLHPHGVTRIGVVPSPKDDWDYREQRLRGLDFTLDAPTDPAAPVVLTGDITGALTGNWGDDARHDVSLVRLGLTWPGPETPTVDEVVLFGPDALYDGPAGKRIADVAGTLHPSWYAHAGATVRLPLHVPDGAVLRFFDASVAGSTDRALTVVDGATRTAVYTTSDANTWRHHEVSLAGWGGRDVVLEWAVSGSGVGLLGAGRVLAGDRGTATPNVVVYLIDTLRADHVGAWGSKIARVSPRIDALAEHGAQFGLAITSSPWTKPAIPTVMTGVWATTHAVGTVGYTDRLPDTVPVVQQRFSDAGWRTGSFTASPLGSTLSGLERGYDTVMAPHAWRGQVGRLGHVSADQVGDAMLAWRDEEPDQPFFAYVHTLEVHAWRRALYSHPPAGLTPYDFAVRDADLRLGDLVDGLTDRGLADNTLIVVLSDHGESFGDHGVKGHGSGLYQSQVHIPLVFWAGDALPALTVTDPVGIADVAPTLLDLFGLPPLPEANGKSLVPYLAGTATAPIHDALPSARLRYIWLPKDPPIYSLVRQDRTKLVRFSDHDEAFDLAADPCEARSLDAVDPALTGALDAVLSGETTHAEAFHAAHGAVAGAVDAEDVEMLREMGYLE